MKRYVFIIIALLFSTTSVTYAQKNLVDNGGFEDDLYEWNNNGANVTHWDFKNGKNSCAITTPDSKNWVGIDQTIRLPKKTQAMEFSAWLKAENVVKGKDDWNGAVFSIEFLDKADKKIGEGLNIATITGDRPWTLMTKQTKIPDGAVSFKVLIAMGYASGTMLADDVSAKVINPEDLSK